MKISCEKCKTLFLIKDKHLNSQGITVLCPKCQYPHFVKRIVIPFKSSKVPKNYPDVYKGTLPQSSSKVSNIKANDSKENPLVDSIEKDLNVDLNLTHNPNKLELHEEKLPPIEDLLALDHKQFTDLVTNADKFPRISSKTKENPLEEFAKDEKEDSFLNNLLNLILSMILGMVIGGGILFFILNKLKFSFSSF